MQHTYTIKAAILGLALLVGGASAGSAQGLPGGASSLNETHGDWTVVCSTAQESVRCAIAQNQVSGENRQRVLAVELQAAEGGASATGMLVLPFGLKLDDGVRLALDEAEPFQTLQFSTCMPTGCLVPLAFDADAVSALRAGSVLALKANANDNGQDVALSVSLNGFTSALARAAELSGS